MFGTNTVQSSWANPQQNQQQQQQGSAFGQPSAFGSGGAFGSTSAFGQQQQQQQQQQPANPMFGNLGNTNPGTSGFGAFSQSTAQPTTSTSAFGAPKPATGFGAFGGGTSTFGGGSTFGSTNAPGTSGTSIFGSGPSTSTGSAFGGGGVFGQNKPATGFGGTSPTTGQDGNVAPVTTGTSSPPYNVFSEKDPSNASLVLQYQTITAMPAYRGTSLEELRMQDYQQNRKTAGAFGQPSYGAPAAQPTGLFGPTTQQPATTSIFGGGTTGAYGSTATSQPGTSAFGSFAQPQQNQPAGSTGTGIFGGSAFGQQQQQQPPQPQPPQQQSSFGAFAQPQQQSASGGTSIFGSGSAFGQPKPATGFGTAFGAPGSTGAFGQPGQTTAGTTSIFGQPQQQQPSQGTGAFGAPSTAKPSIFGQPTQPTGTTGTGFGLFGTQQQPQQAQQPQPAPSLFGGTTTTGGSLFGQPQQAQQQQQQPQPQTGGLFGTTTQPSGGLFGSTTGGSLFGGTQQAQAQQPAQTTSLFGAPKPATTTGSSLFGGGFGQPSTTTTGTGQQTSIFGQPLGQPAATQPSTGTFGSSLFGQQKPTAPALTTSTSTGGLGTSLFGNPATLNASANVPGAQGTLTASIAEPIAPNLPIFSMLPPGPRAVTLDQQAKKKPGFFVDMPTRTPVPHLQLGYTPANSKLRGFGSTTFVLGGQPSSSLGMSLTNGKAGSLSLSRIDGKSQAGPEALLGRSASPAMGSGTKQSVKKLILDKKVEPSDLFSRSASPVMRGSSGRVMFNPVLSQAAREKEVAREKEASSSIPTAPQPASQSTTSPVNVTRQAPNLFTAHSTVKLSQPSSPSKDAAITAPPPLQRGDYWVKPDLAKLKACGYEDLVAFKDLVVGRVGYGEIHFLEPVDLTGLPKLGALLGELVRFDDKECSVYPDGDETDKPAPGSGLNVRARIVLFNCWAVDKATREPIKDEKDPAAVKHLKRLKGMKDTRFESFDIGEGKWTFTVEHF